MALRACGVSAWVEGLKTLQSRFWVEQLLVRPCIAPALLPWSPGPQFLQSSLTRITDPASKTGFLKRSSAIWWQAEAVPRTSELDPVFTGGFFAFLGPSQWGSQGRAG